MGGIYLHHIRLLMSYRSKG